MLSFSPVLPLTSALSILCWSAKAALGMGKTDHAMSLTLQVLRREKKNITGLSLRAQAMYLSEQYDDAIKLAREVCTALFVVAVPTPGRPAQPR